MVAEKQLQADLGFVREAIQRSSSPFSPPSIWYLWATITLIGFTMADFAPERVGMFWLVAVPVGMLGSMTLGIRHGRRLGQINRHAGARMAFHWIGFSATMLLASMMVPLGMLSGRTLGSIALLLTALAYYLAAIHMDRRLIWVALLLAIGYVIVLFVSSFAWTIVGVVVAVAMVVTASSGEERQRDKS